MMRIRYTIALLFVFAVVHAEEPAETTEKVAEKEVQEENGDGISNPKTMSGMSILGNEEAPKSLVIVPWKSSELGAGVGVSRALDTSIRAVDKDVFLRELKYYSIRAGEKR